MIRKPKTKIELLEGIRALRVTLEEAEKAIQTAEDGDIEAFISPELSAALDMAGKAGSWNLMPGIRLNTTERKRMEEAVRESEERYRALVENMYDLVSEIDSDGRLLYLSPNHKEFIGYDASERLGRKVLENVHPDDLPRVIEEFERGKEQGYGHVVYRYKHKGGEWRWLQSIGNKFKASDGSLRAVLVSRDITDLRETEQAACRCRDELEMRVRERTAELERLNELLQTEALKRKRTEEVLLMSEKQLRDLSSRLLVAHEEERKRISRDLHDSIAASLSTVKYRIEAAVENAERGVLTAESLKVIIPTIQQAIQESRRMMSDLRPAMLDDLGLTAALSWHCRQFQSIYSNIRIEKQVEIPEQETPEPLKIVIFRIIQEALNNVAKHSQANLVQIFLGKKDDRIDLVVRDNGRGFDQTQKVCSDNLEQGRGLCSMKERAELSGGSLRIESQTGAGTTVRASWQRKNE